MKTMLMPKEEKPMISQNMQRLFPEADKIFQKTSLRNRQAIPRELKRGVFFKVLQFIF